MSANMTAFNPISIFFLFFSRLSVILNNIIVERMSTYSKTFIWNLTRILSSSIDFTEVIMLASGNVYINILFSFGVCLSTLKGCSAKHLIDQQNISDIIILQSVFQRVYVVRSYWLTHLKQKPHKFFSKIIWANILISLSDILILFCHLCLKF